MCQLLIPQAPTNLFQTLHPSISVWTTHRLPLITSPSKMTTVLICRNAPTDSCHNLTALMPRCTKTSFLITPHYICAHRNSDNLHNAAFKGLRDTLWSGNGWWAPYCGLTSVMSMAVCVMSMAVCVMSMAPMLSAPISNITSECRVHDTSS